MFKRAAVLVVSCGALLAGCGTDLQAENEEITSNLIEAGFRADDIMVVDGAVYVGRDAHVTLEASREMLQGGEGSQEQYRTNNLVGTAPDLKLERNKDITFSTDFRQVYSTVLRKHLKTDPAKILPGKPFAELDFI